MKVKRKKRNDDLDDGRVVAPMNVEGMPWYSGERAPGDAGTGVSADPVAPVKLTFRENVAFMFGVLKAVLLVALVFIGVLLGFILFCIHVWFR